MAHPGSRVFHYEEVSLSVAYLSTAFLGDELSDRWAPDELAARPSCAGLVVFGRMGVARTSGTEGSLSSLRHSR